MSDDSNYGDTAWRLGVDTQLRSIANALDSLIRIEERQTSLMESHNELKEKVSEHEKSLIHLTVLKTEMQSVMHSVNETSKALLQLRDSFDERLDDLEAKNARSDWATRSIERMVAFVAVMGAVLSHFIDLGDP